MVNDRRSCHNRAMKKALPSCILFILIAIGTFYFFGPKDLFIKHQCDLQATGSCHSSIEGIDLDFKVLPLPLRATNEVTYQLKVDGVKVTKATIRLLGHDMRMQEEEQVFDLRRNNEGHLSASRIFPLCTEEVMIWRLYLIIEAEDITLRTLFNLRVERG